MKDNCIICGKHLQTRIAKSEGVGPECKKGFSRKIRICRSISVTNTYIEQLLEDEDYDIVIHHPSFFNQTIWWKTDEAPYIHYWDDGNTPSDSAIKELLEMYGYKMIEDVDTTRWIEVRALSNLHHVDIEDCYYSLFHAIDTNTLTPKYDDERLINTIDDEISTWFHPETHYNFEPDGPLHRLVFWARELGGREAMDVLENLLYYDNPEMVNEELEECMDAFQRGDQYWGKQENPYNGVGNLRSALGDNDEREYTPLEAEEIIIEQRRTWPTVGQNAPPWERHTKTPKDIIKQLINRHPAMDTASLF